MTLEEVYQALEGQENGAEFVSAIKRELSALRNEAAGYRSKKNEAEAKSAELRAALEEAQKTMVPPDELTALKKQVETLTKKNEEVEKARKEEQHKRIQADIMQQTVSALTKGNATNPGEIAKILVGSITAKDDGEYTFTNAKNEEMTIADGAAAWLKENSWAVKNTQLPGSGGGKNINVNQQGQSISLADAVAAKLNN